jgi:hypothetical protein
MKLFPEPYGLWAASARVKGLSGSNYSTLKTCRKHLLKQKRSHRLASLHRKIVNILTMIQEAVN